MTRGQTARALLVPLASLLVVACGGQNEGVASVDALRDSTHNPCSENDDDCGSLGIGCGGAVPATTDDSTFEITVAKPHFTTVRSPTFDESGPVIEGDVDVLEVEVTVRNITDTTRWIDDRPDLHLAEGDTSTIVSSRDPGIHHTYIGDIKIPAQQSQRFDLVVSVGSGRTCDHLDLPAGSYVAIADILERVVVTTTDQSGVERHADTHHYALLEVDLP